MSYCRMGSDSDVYCYRGYGFTISCRDMPGFIMVDTHQECLRQLMKLRRMGFRVPASALKRLRSEIALFEATSGESEAEGEDEPEGARG